MDHAHSSHSDLILLNDLLLTVPLRAGAQWPSNAPLVQPVIATLSIHTDITAAAATDELRHSIDYSQVSQTIVDHLADSDNVPASGFTLELLSSSILSVIFSSFSEIDRLGVKLTQVKSPLHSKSVGIETTWSRDEIRVTPDIAFIQELACELIIGVNPCEREEKQVVSLDVRIEQSVDLSQPLDFRSLIKHLYHTLSATSFLTLEALASKAADECLQKLSSSGPVPPSVRITAKKPSALVLADSPSVQIIRTKADYPKLCTFECAREGAHTAAIAFGSNLGDKFSNIELALRYLETPESFNHAVGLSPEGEALYLDIVNTSFLYESAPMYVEDQPSFINGAILVETNLSPLPLLRLLKYIETKVGRVPSIRNGPRALDLDILFYDNEKISSEATGSDEAVLVVPHPKMREREFVLHPLNDMIPDYVHPVLLQPISSLLAALPPSQSPLQRIIPFPRYPITGPLTDLSVPPTHSHWKYPMNSTSSSTPTRVMATLNVTPDSFSDGSLNNSISSALEYTSTSFDAGADIVDVGGYSTRPGASFVSPQEEIDRVSPTINAIRTQEHASKDVLISVDTFRSDVARSAILAGANCINDVYAFTGANSWPLDLNSTEISQQLTAMKSVARDLAVPLILMHSRGEAGANKDYSMYEYAGSDGAEFIEGVRLELGQKLDSIVKGRGGVRRWMVIVDPGVGFSKSVEANLTILKRAQEVVAPVLIGYNKRLMNPLSGFPLLIGASRKSFLGKILSSQNGKEREPKDRVWATAGAVACAVQQRSLVVRVHDVKEMRDVVTIAEAIWS